MKASVQVFWCFLWLAAAGGCREKQAGPKYWQSELLPAEAVPSSVRISDLNCWVEQDRFFVTGICSNESAAWRRVWLLLTPMAGGKPVAIHDCSAVVVPLFSSAMAPQGRSAFLAGWPLADFAVPPDSCVLAGAKGMDKTAGPILLVEELSGVRMLQPAQPGQPQGEEFAWQIQAILNNPLPQTAAHPRLELLLYGSDNKLWYSTLLNPEDPKTAQVLQMQKAGPMAPGEKRPFGILAYYQLLPKALQTGKIARAEALAFEER